ncbi:MAG: (4Fe-4S)-binding protein [Gemmatimonadaceae bacterium]|nr:(4Fe-4S)-binding protein [Gemmatimonadaceae bacterium]
MAEDAPADPETLTRIYPASEVAIEWRQGLCQHSGNCVKAHARVFNPRRKPWIETEQGTDDEIRAAVARCPSGALRIRELG